MRAGADDYIVKSKEMPYRLRAAVRTAVDRASQRRAAKDAERRASDAHQRLMVAIDAMPGGLALYDSADRLLIANRGLDRTFPTLAGRILPGMRYDEIVELGAKEAIYAYQGEELEKFVHRRLELRRNSPGAVVSFELADGRWIQANERRTGDGGMIQVFTDITLVVEAKRRAASAHQHLRDAVEAMNGGFAMWNPDDRLILANRAYRALLEEDEEIVVPGRTFEEIFHMAAGAGSLKVLGDVEEIISAREVLKKAAFSSIERQTRDGWIDIFHKRRDDGSQITVVTDITALKRREIEFAEKSALLQTTLENMAEGISVFDRDLRLVAWNAKYRDYTDLPADVVKSGVTAVDIIRFLAARDGDGNIEADVDRRMDRLRRGGFAPRSYRRPDGRLIEIRRSTMPDGGIVSLYADISERAAMEDQLRQANKMEAIGQLTGGIAHDFNNLLSIIMGNLDLLEDRLKQDPGAAELGQAALTAALRGAELTSQLLAFARRQPLQPKATGLNEMVRGMIKFLQRSLGEHIDIELIEGDSLAPALVDAAQVETALANLAINARDAMPEGGKLIIETANKTLDENYVRSNPEAAAGDYVLIAVTDTGVGIPPDVISRVFEPFFTTKEKGKGTGLGLSMVYGFVTQSGGHVKIDSEVGKGTTVRLYLPRAKDAAAAAGPTDHGKIIHGTGQTILVVDDNSEVREVVVRQLQEFGYSVVEAKDAKEALDLLARGLDLDLLFTDIVMPGRMSGVELARASRARCPGLKVLFTSGYSDAALAKSDLTGENIDLLSKPYRKGDLARKIHEALTRPVSS